jgi:hypothetical protein
MIASVSPPWDTDGSTAVPNNKKRVLLSDESNSMSSPNSTVKLGTSLEEAAQSDAILKK